MSNTRTGSPPARGLSQGHFRRIATHGFGDGINSYPWSAAWFEDRLYIGTNRHGLVLSVSRGTLPSANFEIDPVPMASLPPDQLIDQLDMRGQIWRYDPKTDRWQCVFRSPLVQNAKGRTVPPASGFRNMVVFQGRRDPKPVIYTLSSASFSGMAPILFRSSDGDFFEPVGVPGLGFSAGFTNFRAVCAFKGKMFIAPGATSGKSMVASNVVELFCTDDPASGKWAKTLSSDVAGDPTNVGVYDMAACGDFLYLSTVNIRNGFQLWKTRADGRLPYHWIKVIDHGADRGRFNQGTAGFGVFKGDLYMGTFVQNGGYDRHHDVGPIAAEVLRVHPDDSWDLVVGEPRITRTGLKLPTSGREAGFGNHLNGYVWRLASHEGALYAGTLNSSSYLTYSRRANWPTWLQNLLHPTIFDEDHLTNSFGCEVWRTLDGDRWEPVARHGFGNHFNLGVRAMVSTPRGLFLGLVNPFGPAAAIKGPGGWRYQPNPHGGLEIWLGDWSHAGSAPEEPANLPSDDLPPLSWQDEQEWTLGSSQPRADSLWQRLFAQVGGWAPADRPAFFRPLHQIAQEDAPAREEWQAGPAAVLASAQKDLIGPAENALAEVAAYFERGLQNVGYWRDAKMTPRQAAGQLLVELLYLLPEPLCQRHGGATSQAPLQEADLSLLIICPGSDLGTLGELIARVCPTARQPVLIPRLQTEPQTGLPRLELADESFDVIVWIEEPVCFASAALMEAHRVLKAGGHFLLADFVGGSVDEPVPVAAAPDGPIEVCTRLLVGAGFAEVRVIDVLRKTWIPFFRQSRWFFSAKHLFGQLEEEDLQQVLDALPGGGLAVQTYVVASAVKRQTTQTASGQVPGSHRGGERLAEEEN